MSLPSYHEAIAGVGNGTVWEIIVGYLDTPSLANLCKLSGTNDAATAELWSNPVPRILNLSRSCVRFIYFFSHASQVRPRILDRVRSLDLRNLGVHSQLRHQCRMCHDPDTCEDTIAGGRVCQTLHLFPRLRYLLLDGLTGFRQSVFMIFGPTREVPVYANALYPLMVSAAYCPGLNPRRIIQSRNVSNLIYLDLSGLKSSEQWHIRVLQAMPNLRILKLRAVGLTDSQAQVLLSVEAARNIWSLDIRDNKLTSAVFNLLIAHSPPKLESSRAYQDISPDMKYDEDPPVYAQHHPDLEDPRTLPDVVPLRPDSEDGFVKYLNHHANMVMVHPLEPSDAVLRITGLTHLYISANNISSSGVAELLQSKLGTRLQHLDVGSAKGIPSRVWHTPWGFSEIYSQTLGLQHLSRSSTMRLEILRIHHSIITNISSITNPRMPASELPFHAEAQQSPTEPLRTPNSNPRIHTLILTDVPRRTLGPVLHRLQNFILACAEQESELATILSSMGRRNRRSPQLLLGLQLLVLEFQDRHHHQEQEEQRESVSGDPDADEFIAQSANDFSFFSSEAAAPPPTPAPAAATASVRSLGESRDVVAELRAWRRSEEGRRWGGRLQMRGEGL